MAISDAGKLEYLEGTLSAFDFVDTRKWCMKYLEQLCEQLGYMGSKKFYGFVESSERLKLIDCEADTWMLIKEGESCRDFTIYLDGERNCVNSIQEKEDVEGEVLYLDDEQENVDVEQEVELQNRLKRRYKLTYIDIDKSSKGLVSDAESVDHDDGKGNALSEEGLGAGNGKVMSEGGLGAGKGNVMSAEGLGARKGSVRVAEGSKAGKGSAEGLGARKESVRVAEGSKAGKGKALGTDGLEGGKGKALSTIMEDDVEGMESDAEGSDGMDFDAEGSMAKRKGKAVMEDFDESATESDDEYFSADEDSCDELLDDVIYKENVDYDVEWIGPNEQGEGAAHSESSSDIDDRNDMDELESLPSDNDEGTSNVVNEVAAIPQNAAFYLGQLIGTKLEFKEAVNSHSVEVGRTPKFAKNDSRRIYAKCKKADEGCAWHIHALKVNNEASFQIRELSLLHTCARQFHKSNAKSGWLAKRFERTFRCDPKKSIKSFRKHAISELEVCVSHQQAIRAREKVMKLIEGSNTDQYARLWDYAECLRARNPDSTVILQCDVGESTNKFKRFYVCLGAVKRGFKSGCRPWIGVDGCHLSGLNTSVLLTAVCMDPNNDPYPLAYAVVSVENKESWEWFLLLLKCYSYAN